jgi:DNA-binding response OmpR family regulator
MDSVLLIDDDIELCSMLCDYLVPHGLRLTVRHHGITGMEAARNNHFDLIILDVMLPGMDGFSVLQSLRSWSDIGVLMLTARGGEDDRIAGLEIGADDYLPKPFNPRELLSRMRAILRRGKNHSQLNGESPAPTRRITVDEIVIDHDSRTAYSKGQIIYLTDIEFELLAAFLESPGLVLSREMLVERVFKRQFHPEDRSLDIYISRLRRKLDGHDPMKSRIRTVRSVGYLFSLKCPTLATNG